MGKLFYNVCVYGEVRDKIVLMFQFKTDFTDTNRHLNLALNPHLLYTLLPAVYFFCNYIKNIYKKVCVYKNKLYLYTVEINK